LTSHINPQSSILSFSPPSHATVGDNTMIVTRNCIPLDCATYVPY